MPERTAPPVPDAPAVLRLADLRAGGTGRAAIAIRDLYVRSGEIVGIAGISGNGQTTLVDVLSGQARPDSGTVAVGGRPYGATREETLARGVRLLPEEPLRNACVPRMSVAENMSFRRFDRTAVGGSRRLLDHGRDRREAERLIARYGVKTQGPGAPIGSLSGGNVQRAALARELDGEARLLVVANPCFGLDFGAVADIRGEIVAARNRGTAVLLLSEDLDEVVTLSDRILVLFEGRVVFECAGGALADTARLGAHMAGHA